MRLTDLHHVTAVCSDARRTVAFYRDLGLKLVKRTVNYDDPRGYHLYMSGADGTPGTLLTFLEWRRTGRGRLGRGLVETIGLKLPGRSEVQRIEDPDGLRLELQPGDRPELTHVYAYGEPSFYRDLLEDDSPLRFLPPFRVEGVHGAGIVHHTAWRIGGEEQLTAWRAHLVDRGLRPTRVFDRTYFKSLYVHMPDGLLLELATDGPGLLVDEPAGALGSKLVLPAWLEPRRPELESGLGPV